MYQCRLKIDGRDKKLSFKDIISFKAASELLLALSKCLEKRETKFILKSIEESSYCPVLETEEEADIEKFKSIHKDLKNHDFQHLESEEQEYATYLNKILFKNGLCIKATNSFDDTEIDLIEIDKPPKNHFSSFTSLQGQVVLINGKNEKNPYIVIKTSNKDEYKIRVNESQEKQLKKYYKEGSIRVRIKAHFTTNFENKADAILVDFDVPRNISFNDAISDTKARFGDIFKGINDSAQLIRDLRNTS